MRDVPRNADLHEVIRREKLLLDPAVRAVGDEVAALLHVDFVEFGASGRVWDRAAIIDALVSAGDEPGPATDFHAEALADDVVLLTYRVSGARGSLRSSVWVRDSGGDWTLRFHQGTPAG